MSEKLNLFKVTGHPFWAFCGKSLLRAQNQSDFHQMVRAVCVNCSLLLKYPKLEQSRTQF
jgi:hypothetical protein